MVVMKVRNKKGAFSIYLSLGQCDSPFCSDGAHVHCNPVFSWDFNAYPHIMCLSLVKGKHFGPEEYREAAPGQTRCRTLVFLTHVNWPCRGSCSSWASAAGIHNSAASGVGVPGFLDPAAAPYICKQRICPLTLCLE